MIGMTAEECLAAWGAPHRINRTTTQAHVREQWVYSYGNRYLYLEDDILQSIQN